MTNRTLSLAITALVLSAIAPLANAACTANYCLDVHIDHLYVNNGGVGTVYVFTTGDESSMTGCTAHSNGAFTLTVNTDGGRAIFSTLLTAVAADRPVDVVAIGNSSGCTVAYVRIRQQ